MQRTFRVGTIAHIRRWREWGGRNTLWAVLVIEVGRHSQVLWVNELRVFSGGFRFEGDVQSGQTP